MKIGEPTGATLALRELKQGESHVFAHSCELQAFECGEYIKIIDSARRVLGVSNYSIHHDSDDGIEVEYLLDGQRRYGRKLR